MRIKDKFRDVVRRLTKEERELLKEGIGLEGIRNPIVLYNESDFILDGHHRWEIAQELALPESEIPTYRAYFENEDQAVEWIRREHVGRRNLNTKEYKLETGKLYNERKGQRGGDRKSGKNPEKTGVKSKAQNEPLIASTAEEIAEERGVSRESVKRSGKLAASFDKLAEPAQKLYTETSKLSDAHVEALAKKPAAKQAEICTAVRKGLKTADEAIYGKVKPKSNGKAKTPADLAKKNRDLAHQYRDKLARAICDYHEVKPNRKERDRLVKVVQGVTLW